MRIGYTERSGDAPHLPEWWGAAAVMEVNTISVTNSSGTDVAVETETTTQGERFFLVLAIFIGLFSGLSVVCFRTAIDFIRITLLGSSLSPSYPRVLLAPTITGLLIAALVVLLFQR